MATKCGAYKGCEEEIQSGFDGMCSGCWLRFQEELGTWPYCTEWWSWLEHQWAWFKHWLRVARCHLWYRGHDWQSYHPDRHNRPEYTRLKCSRCRSGKEC